MLTARIGKIVIEGGCFVLPTELDLFGFDDKASNKSKIVRGVLLYGRNGSGKSTIGRAFSKIVGDNDNDIKNVVLLDEFNNKLDLSNNENNNIYVFNESFIDKNVKIQAKHLNTIVILGKTVELEDKLNNLKNELRDNENNLDESRKKYEEYQSRTNSIKKELDEKLRNGWADRYRIIYDMRQNAQVKNRTYEQFEIYNCKIEHNKLYYLNEYNLKMDELTNRRNNFIEHMVPKIDQKYFEFDDKAFVELINKKIDKPELTEKEKKILDLSSSEIILRKNVLHDANVNYCPFCFQKLNNEYKQDLIKSIEKVFSQELDNYLVEIEKYKLQTIQIDLTPYEKLNGYNETLELIKKINDIIVINNECIQNKYDKPYGLTECEDRKFKIEIDKLKNKLDDLETKRQQYNDEQCIDNLKCSLESINKLITCLELKCLIKKYKKYMRRLSVFNDKLEGLKGKCSEISDKIQMLQSELENKSIALDIINKDISYIFCNKDRLSIKFEDDNYCVYSFGKKVSPNKLSTGEINAIALSYFFTSIMENKDKDDGYGEEYLLIIDDPVSSFDIENRIGILSFLRYKLSKFFEGNNNTKVLIMTHDLQTMFDLQKVFSELIDLAKEKFPECNSIYNSLELKNAKIERFNNKRQEYTELLKIMYSFAFENSKGYEYYIGNIARQVLEAFATFNYKKSIEDVSNDKEVINNIPNEYRAFYSNYMYRLVLHGGSHREEQIKSMKDYNFFSDYSYDEKVNTIKTILCFIYLLNKVHLLKHLQGCKDVENSLNSWLKNTQLWI